METELSDGKRVPVLETTAHIVAAYLEKNRIPTNQIAVLIALVSSKLAALSSPVAVVAEQPKPPMNPKKTISPDFIISLENGKPYKSLKRHLGLRGLTPFQYREKWGLPADYPMVAPNYSAARSALAVKIGLGRKRPAKKAVKKRSSE